MQMCISWTTTYYLAMYNYLKYGIKNELLVRVYVLRGDLLVGRA